MLSEGKVKFPFGLFADSDAPVSVALGKHGEQLVSELWPMFSSLAYRQKLFNAVSGSVTVASTHVSPLTAATGKPVLGVWNPPNSGVNLLLVKHCVLTLSGTPGGPMLWNYALNSPITASANVTPVNGLLGSGAAKAQWFSDTALTGSVVGIALRHAWNLSAVAAAFADSVSMENDNGDIVVPPGAFLGLAAFATGTSHVVQASMVVAEIPTVAAS